MKQRPSHPDASLLKACVSFAVAVRGASGAYDADVTDGCEFAQTVDQELLKRAQQALCEVTSYLPSTLDGLRSKAEIVDMAFEAMPSAPLKAFLQSLSADVARFHKAAADASVEVAQ